MKAGVEHRVPLSQAARAVLEEMMFGEHSQAELVFPAPRGGMIDTKTLPSALKAAGVNATVHGFRSTFRDWCSETGVPDRAAEVCLAHAVGNKVEAAYLRTDLFEQRAEVMERWADYVAA